MIVAMLETKLFIDWKPLMIMLCYIHQAQQTNTCPNSTIETLEQSVKDNQSCQ